jgi:hypothetical protein
MAVPEKDLFSYLSILTVLQLTYRVSSVVDPVTCSHTLNRKAMVAASISIEYLCQIYLPLRSSMGVCHLIPRSLPTQDLPNPRYLPGPTDRRYHLDKAIDVSAHLTAQLTLEVVEYAPPVEVWPEARHRRWR